MELIEGNVVLCTVKKIEKTTVFLEIEGNGEGSMVFSEVAAGRIRNIREYVAPNKKIVCKVLKIDKGIIELSFRRVTAKEREFVLDKYKRERNYSSMLKTIIKDPKSLIEKIKEKYDFVEFIDDSRDKPELLNEFLNEEQSDALSKILIDKIQREKEVKKTFKITTSSPSGLTDIKEILNIKNVEINYLGSSKFSLKIKAPDFKEANKKLQEVLEEIEKRAKDKKAILEIKEK